MTTDQEAENVTASVRHLLTQRGIDAREWQRQSNQWEQRWRDVTAQLEAARLELATLRAAHAAQLATVTGGQP